MAARCTDPLNHAEAPKIRASRAGKWRALSLVLVHALVAIHIVHWMKRGSSLTPLEPSESMEFAKTGLVNAGLLFFVLMIASTLVFGRWFCGWACHIVALQDGARWLLHKLGIRPRAVNLGLLAVVPWLAFAYMFLGPLAERAIEGVGLGVSGVQLTRPDFWGTFPPWPVALATFLVCGLAIVYLLGAKGFCTYGCPYGAIFGVVDQLAPMRIVVSDACEGCGHCTAVCSSNVKVHQEVRDFGAVVDPGCMKCLDCVSVCPKNALSVGWGAPAIAKKTRKPLDPRPKTPLARWLGLLGFELAALAVFQWHGGAIEPRLVLVLGLLSFAVTVAFKSKAQRRAEYTLAEELVLGLLFLLAMLAFRGWHDSVPFLFALGLSSVLAYLGLQALRLAWKRDVSIQRWHLRTAGKLSRVGVSFTVLCLPLAGVWTWAWRDQSALREKSAQIAARERAHAEALAAYNEGVSLAQQNQIDGAAARFRRSVELDPEFIEAREDLAGMLCASGHFREGIAEYGAALQRHPDDAGTHALVARAYVELGEYENARGALERALALQPDDPGLREFHAQVLAHLRSPK